MKNRTLFKTLITIYLTSILTISFFFSSAYAASWPDRDLMLGMTGEDVAVLQSTLEAMGYYVGGADGYFGMVTQNAVCQYQSDHNLYVDGVAGRITYNSLFDSQISVRQSGNDDAVSSSAAYRTLYQGLTGSDVYKLQSWLESQGYWTGGADGYFGSYTETVVRQYQSEHGLYVDGVVGPETLNCMNSEQPATASKLPENDENTFSGELKKGMSGVDVAALQSRLEAIGYDVGGTDGYFGNYTETAVRQYQSDHGLYVDGIAGSETMNSLNSSQLAAGEFSDLYEQALPRELKKGMSGSDVAALQSMLIQLGYPVNTIDGVFGPYTEAAVIAFQRDHSNLYSDGIVGVFTRDVLNSELAELSDKASFMIRDRVIEVGTTTTIKPVFTDKKDLEITLTSNSPLISISGMNITALETGSAEVRAEYKDEVATFLVEVKDNKYIETNYGNIENANSYNKGIIHRLQELDASVDDANSLVLFAGDSYLDERLYMTDFYDSRFADGNVYSIAISGSTANQWRYAIPLLYWYQPDSLVMNIGLNDIRHGETALTVIDDLTALFDFVQKYMPNTKVYWWNISPHIGADTEYYEIVTVNSAMQEYSRQNENLVIVNAYDALSDSNGVANASLYRDNLHPNSVGYDRLIQKTYQAGLKIPQSEK